MYVIDSNELISGGGTSQASVTRDAPVRTEPPPTRKPRALEILAPWDYLEKAGPLDPVAVRLIIGRDLR
jgi:hypothetical protein